MFCFSLTPFLFCFFSHPQNGDNNSTHFKNFCWRVMQVYCLKPFLEHSMWSVYVGCHLILLLPLLLLLLQAFSLGHLDPNSLFWLTEGWSIANELKLKFHCFCIPNPGSQLSKGCWNKKTSFLYLKTILFPIFTTVFSCAINVHIYSFWSWVMYF